MGSGGRRIKGREGGGKEGTRLVRAEIGKNNLQRGSLGGREDKNDEEGR